MPSWATISARSEGPRFLASKGTMHQATKLSWAQTCALFSLAVTGVMTETVKSRQATNRFIGSFNKKEHLP